VLITVNAWSSINLEVILPCVHSNKLMKKGGGTGPVKPWQPPITIFTVKE